VRTHYYPPGLARYDADGHDYVERGPCGTWLGEGSKLIGDWSRVDCMRCLKEKPAITASSEAEERAIVQQMGDMADFMRAQQGEQP